VTPPRRHSALRAARDTLRLNAASQREVRARNESAWLLPNDGTRFDQRLIADMRRYDESDEVDLVIVGCGA
jgi:Asp/Glu/hydantoin racemase